MTVVTGKTSNNHICLMTNKPYFRGTFSGCFATTLGSVCHELCHTFDLGHTESGIMARGFDKINEEFILTDKMKFYKKPPEQHCTVDFTPNIKINITENRAQDNKKIINHNTEYIHKKMSVNENGIYFTRNCLMLLYYHRYAPIYYLLYY